MMVPGGSGAQQPFGTEPRHRTDHIALGRTHPAAREQVTMGQFQRTAGGIHMGCTVPALPKDVRCLLGMQGA